MRKIEEKMSKERFIDESGHMTQCMVNKILIKFFFFK